MGTLRHILAYLFLVIVVLAPVLLAKGTSTTHALVAGTRHSHSLADLWIDLRIGPPLIPLFEEVAREDDMARVDHYSQIGQLDTISAGKKLVIFKSIAEAQEALPTIASKIDVIGYNLEHGPGTPPDEQSNPVASVATMQALADTFGLQLAFGPDHDFALSHGVAVAPFVDIFVLQIQRQQTNPPVVEEFILPIVPQLRNANPNLQISVQVRTEGDVSAVVELLETLHAKVVLDGVSILTSPDTVDEAYELVYALRQHDPTEPPGGGTNRAIFLPTVLADR